MKLFKKKKQSFKKQWNKSDYCKFNLIIHNNKLLIGKRNQSIIKSNDSIVKLTPIEIATAARRLLPSRAKRQHIALTLPSSEFVATSLNLPAIAAQNLENVVNLQRETLLPGVTEPLLLAVQAPLEGERTIALWLPLKRAEELWQAFKQVGLFLRCIIPRPLIALPPKKSTPYFVYDEDNNNITGVEWSSGVIKNWLHVPKIDRENLNFEEQFEEALLIFRDIQQNWKTNLKDWNKLTKLPPKAYDYAFTPPSASAFLSNKVKKKNTTRISLLILLVVASLGGGASYAIDYKKGLEEQLVKLKKRTLNISRLRAEVGEIKENIGAITNFPNQPLIIILNSLNQMIPQDSWLVGFRIEGGKIKFEGYSPNPTALIEILNKIPQIYQIEQNRGTTTELGRKELRFGISFKLKGYDLASYWTEYFPKKR